MPLLTPINNRVVKDKNLASRFKGTAHNMALPFSVFMLLQRQNFKQTLLGISALEIKIFLLCYLKRSQNLNHTKKLQFYRGVSFDLQSYLSQY